MNIKFSSKTYLVLILVFSTLIVWPVFIPGLFFHHDDLQVMRIFEMKRCFEDLQIPCRWVPDMGYGNGFPLFNYYSALPYYIGAILSYVLGLINSAKALFFIPLLLGGISMFFLSKKLFGKDAAFLSAILYAFAPYRALDSYVRGAIAESFALAIIPLVFYGFIEIIEKPTGKKIALTSLAFAAFLLSHNIMTMFFTPFLILWILIFLFNNKWKNWKAPLVGFILGITTAAFFLLPVFFEKNLVQTETLIQGGSDFRTHFVGISQLFLDRSWGYGGSQFGPNDTISFQIGIPQWLFVVLAIPFFIFYFRKNFKLTIIAAFLFFMFLVSIFMQHNKSAFIWEAIGSLQYAQFPWRFLSLSIFSSSLIAGYVYYFFSFKYKLYLMLTVVVLTVWLNWNFFKPREFYPWINDQNKLEDPLWEIQQKAGIMDYLPKTAYEPQGRAPDNIEVLEGVAQGSNYEVHSNSFSVDVDVKETARIQIPIFDFPDWEVYVDKNKLPHDNKSTLGRITLNLSPGTYKLKGYFQNTPIRTASDIITLLSFLILIFISTNKKIQKQLSNGH